MLQNRAPAQICIFPWIIPNAADIVRQVLYWTESSLSRKKTIKCLVTYYILIIQMRSDSGFVNSGSCFFFVFSSLSERAMVLLTYLETFRRCSSTINLKSKVQTVFPSYFETLQYYWKVELNNHFFPTNPHRNPLTHTETLSLCPTLCFLLLKKSL